MLGFTAMFTLLRDDPPPLNFSDYWFIGVICSLLACFGTVCGMLLQKYSHNLDPRIEGNAARKNRLWWTSLFLMIVVPAPLDVIALGLAAQVCFASLRAAPYQHMSFSLIGVALLADASHSESVLFVLDSRCWRLLLR